MALTLVLSVGLDPELLITRNLVLQSAGYTVVAAFSPREAVDRLREGDFDLVLLCQSIPTKDKDHLVLWLRAFGSRIPVISISGFLYQRDAFADATVVSDPNVLLMAIREVLIIAAAPAVRTPASCEKGAGVLPQKEMPAAPGKKPPKPSAANGQRTKDHEGSSTRRLSGLEDDREIFQLLSQRAGRFLHFSERGTSCPKRTNNRVYLLSMMRMSSRRPWQ